MGKCDTTQNVLVGKVLEGMKRLQHRVDTRLPVTGPILAQIVKVLPLVCLNKFEALLFQAAFTMTFFGFFRVGELCLSKGGNPSHVVGRGDVTLVQGQYVQVHLRYSKTDPSGKGTIIQLRVSDNEIYSLIAMEAFLKVRPGVGGPLLCHFSGQSVTRYQFSSVLQKALRYLDIDTASFKTHSFRIGAASAAFKAGHTADALKEAGRWKSNCYSHYIRIPIITFPDL